MKDFETYGITPAWAGKSRDAIDGAGGGGDYPRVGGEESKSPRDLMTT